MGGGQCSPGLNPGFSIMSAFSLLLALPLRQGFLSGISAFPSFTENELYSDLIWNKEPGMYQKKINFMDKKN